MKHVPSAIEILKKYFSDGDWDAESEMRPRFDAANHIVILYVFSLLEISFFLAAVPKYLF